MFLRIIFVTLIVFVFLVSAQVLHVGKWEAFAGGGVGDTGDAKQALLAPTFLALDKANMVMYVSDTATHRIRKIDLRTNVITTIAGIGFDDYSGDKYCANEK